MNVAGAGLPAGSSQTLALWTPRVAPATSHMPGLALPVPMRQSILVDAGKTCLARSCRGRAIRGGLQDSALPLCSMPGRGEGGSHSCLLSSGLSCQPPAIPSLVDSPGPFPEGGPPTCETRRPRSLRWLPGCPAPLAFTTPQVTAHCALHPRDGPGRVSGPSTEQLRPGSGLTRLCCADLLS